EYQVYGAAQPFTSVADAQLLQTVSRGTKQVTVSGLTRNETRYFAVLAVDLQGLKQAAVTSIAVTPEDVQAPEDATALQVQPGADQLALSWQAS
ncbi:hypothetical protein, partial [Pseudomonas sp. BMS12]|uniref:hypothetical protein n=1 Tax=Pseudomonas sp. BMS12 TaxID=1796033 RepID=UPI00191C0599